jgi:hypothetical protein
MDSRSGRTTPVHTSFGDRNMVEVKDFAAVLAFARSGTFNALPRERRS